MFVQLTCYFSPSPFSFTPLSVTSLSRSVCVWIFLCVRMICSACGFFCYCFAFSVVLVLIDSLWSCASPCSRRVHMAKNVLLLHACRKLDLAVFLLLVAYFYISSMLFLFDRMSGEDFNAFIIGCVYGCCFFFSYWWMGLGVFSANNQAIAPMSFGNMEVCVCVCVRREQMWQLKIDLLNLLNASVFFFVNKWCIYFTINHYPSDTWYCNDRNQTLDRRFFSSLYRLIKNEPTTEVTILYQLISSTIDELFAFGRSPFTSRSLIAFFLNLLQIAASLQIFHKSFDSALTDLWSKLSSTRRTTNGRTLEYSPCVNCSNFTEMQPNKVRIK